MRPTIDDGDRLLINTQIHELRRGDIIQFKYPKDPSKYYMKRIIGLPGETVGIREGKVYINGELLDENYIAQEYNQNLVSFPDVKIPEESFYVMGDNRDNSSDSRYWGTVKRELIDGKVDRKY
jgi:signal peptidase I